MNAHAAEEHLHVIREELRNESGDRPRPDPDDVVIKLDNVSLSFDRPIVGSPGTELEFAL